MTPTGLLSQGGSDDCIQTIAKKYLKRKKISKMVLNSGT